jgi:hypothetical protein
MVEPAADQSPLTKHRPCQRQSTLKVCMLIVEALLAAVLPPSRAPRRRPQGELFTKLGESLSDSG